MSALSGESKAETTTTAISSKPKRRGRHRRYDERMVSHSIRLSFRSTRELREVAKRVGIPAARICARAIEMALNEARNDEAQFREWMAQQEEASGKQSP